MEFTFIKVLEIKDRK